MLKCAEVKCYVRNLYGKKVDRNAYFLPKNTFKHAITTFCQGSHLGALTKLSD